MQFFPFGYTGSLYAEIRRTWVPTCSLNSGFPYSSNVIHTNITQSANMRQINKARAAIAVRA